MFARVLVGDRPGGLTFFVYPTFLYTKYFKKSIYKSLGHLSTQVSATRILLSCKSKWVNFVK